VGRNAKYLKKPTVYNQNHHVYSSKKYRFTTFWSWKEALYLKLVEQINKDFNLANEAIDFPMSISPNELKIQVHEKIYRLIQYKFAEYLNLLYIIDLWRWSKKNGWIWFSYFMEQVSFT
jgi:hypothetical protein